MTQGVLYWYRDSQVDQFNQIESPEIDLCLYGNLICYRDSNTNWWGKRGLLKQGAFSMGGKLILDFYFMLYTKMCILNEDLTVKIELYNFGKHTHQHTYYPRKPQNNYWWETLCIADRNLKLCDLCGKHRITIWSSNFISGYLPQKLKARTQICVYLCS